MKSLIGPGRSVGKWLGMGALAVAVAAGTVMASHDFTDVPDSHPFHAEISNLVGAGITGGCNIGLYCPDSPVTRAQMAAFLGRGLGRAARANGMTTVLPGVAGDYGPFVTLATLTISVPGTTGTQFVNLQGEAALFTNSTRALACSQAIACSIHLYLFDGPAQVAESFIRISADGSGGSVPVSAVVAAPAGTSRTYTLQARTFSMNPNTAVAVLTRLIGTTFPFGGTGGATLAPETDELARSDAPSATTDLTTGR